jgi:hypothetical protein
MSGFRDKQRTLVNTVGVPEGMQVQVPARAEEACQIYDPTTKLIFLRRSPMQAITLGLLWPKFTHKYCIQKEIIKNKGKVPAKKIILL